MRGDGDPPGADTAYRHKMPCRRTKRGPASLAPIWCHLRSHRPRPLGLCPPGLCTAVGWGPREQIPAASSLAPAPHALPSCDARPGFPLVRTALASVPRHHKPQLPRGRPAAAQRLFKELWLRPPPEWSRLFSAASGAAALTGCSPRVASVPALVLAPEPCGSPGLLASCCPMGKPKWCQRCCPKEQLRAQPFVPFSTRE